MNKNRGLSYYVTGVMALFVMALSHSAAFQESFTHTPSGLSLNTEMGGLKMVKKMSYRDERLGVSYLYKDRNSNICSLYIYHAGYKDIKDGVKSKPVSQQFNNARIEIKSMANQGRYKLLSEVSTRKKRIKTGSGTIRYLWAMFEFEAYARARESHLLITARNGHFIKVRCTYLLDNATEGRKIFESFSKDLSTVLLRSSK
jgi:hypothetical protein